MRFLLPPEGVPPQGGLWYKAIKGIRGPRGAASIANSSNESRSRAARVLVFRDLTPWLA